MLFSVFRVGLGIGQLIGPPASGVCKSFGIEYSRHKSKFKPWEQYQHHHSLRVEFGLN